MMVSCATMMVSCAIKNDGIMCDNPGIWYNSSQVNLTNEESCQTINCKTKYNLESQNPLRNNRARLTWNNCAIVTWEQSCQSHLGIIVPVFLVGLIFFRCDSSGPGAVQ